MSRVSLTLFIVSFIGFVLTPIVLFAKSERTLRPPLNIPLRRIWWVFVALILLSVFGAFTGDYPSFKIIVQELNTRRSYLSYTHFEEVYSWLALAVRGNYDLWRLGIALFSYISLYFCLKISGSLNYRTLFLFSTWELWGAVMGRQQCSIYILMLGLLLIWIKRKYFFGLLLIIASYFLHKGGMIGLTILPFIFIKVDNKNVILLAILFPILVSSEQLLVDYLKNDEEFAGRNYLEIDDFDRTLFNQIDYWCRVISAYALGIWTMLRFKKYKHIKWCNYMARFLMGAIYVSSLLYFLPIDQKTPFDRSLRFWYLPFCLISSRAMHPKLDRNMFIIGLSWFNMLLVVLYMIMSFRGQAVLYYNDLF